MKPTHVLTSKSQSNKGFTLIELSLVIVIIGLIVAGVVGGQSLVRQSKVRSVTADHQMISTALAAFKLEYSGLPGDIRNASSYWPGATNGNGDGLFAGTEIRRAFTQLGLAKIMPQLSGVSPGTTNHYVNKFDHYISLNNNNFQYQRPRVNMILFEGDKVYGNPQPGFLSPKEAFSIDNKLDDADPTRGIFVVTNPVGGGGTCLTAGWGGPVGSANYVLSSTDKSCRIMFFCKSQQKNCIP